MKQKPDFYIYGGGDTNPAVLDTVRACWKLGTINSDKGREISVIRVEPALPVGPLFGLPNADVIGLASRSTTLSVGDFGQDAVAGAVVWRIAETQSGRHAAVSSVGIVMIWKNRPEE